MIQVKNLVKKYGDYLAVDHLSFEVEKGQIYGFLGPNGAGKSTTMNIITGYLGATEGSVMINGFNIMEEAEAAKKCIGYLPELPPLYVEMTVQEYLMFAAELKKIPKTGRQEQIDKAMEITGLDSVSGRLIRNLSKGYMQRTGLAQAILGFPEVIILDEPTVGLDPKQIIEIRDLIKELSKNHTIILSSHILSEVSAICDHVMIIAKGQLAASDTPENLGRIMDGSNRLTVSVKGTRAEVEQAVEVLEGVMEYEISEGEAGILTVCLETKADCDIREPLFYALAEQKCPIFHMQITKASLEDVFLELTSPETVEEEEEDFDDDSDI